MKTIEANIILVEDHVIVRNGLKEIIEKIGPYRVLREYNNGREFISELLLEPHPDIVIMDITMPEMNGDEVMDYMNQQGIKIPVLILSLNEEENKIIRLFRQGVRGYLYKNCTAAMMKSAIEEILRCGFYHNELLAFALKTSEKPAKKTDCELILEKLTQREKEFLKLVCHEDEYTYEQISSMMGVQPRTVDGYREALFDKYSIKSKTGLVLFVLKHNLFDHL